jgi:hypothetical protein
LLQPERQLPCSEEMGWQSYAQVPRCGQTHGKAARCVQRGDARAVLCGVLAREAADHDHPLLLVDFHRAA